MLKSHAAAAAVVLAALAVPAAALADDPPIAVSHASGGADVSDVAQTSVVLHAGVVANGHALSCEVDYARDDFDDPDTGPYAAAVPCREAVQPGAPGEQAVSAALSGLQPGSHYRFQFLITDRNDASVTRHTNESSFTTLATAPGVLTGGVTALDAFGATLNGTIDPHGGETTCRFDVGPTTVYDNEVSCANKPGSGEGPVAVYAGLGDLTPGATYHFRLVGAKHDQEVAGADQTFTVPAFGGGGTATGGGSGTTGGGMTTTGGGPGSGGAAGARAGRLVVPAAARSRSGRVALRLRCSAGPCHGTLTLKARLTRGGRARAIGHATVRLEAGRSATVTVRLTAAARSALRRHHTLAVRIAGAGVNRALRLS
jgi:hypothetical protein